MYVKFRRIRAISAKALHLALLTCVDVDNYGKIKKRTNFEKAKTYEDLDQFA